jgi:translocation and assembly module TamB
MPARQARRSGLAALGALLVFVCTLPIAVVLHADTAAMRGLVVATVNQAISDTFRGKLELQAPSHLGLRGFEGAAAVLRDDQGRPVAVVDGVDARLVLTDLARVALRPGGQLRVVLSRVRIGRVEATLVRGADGQPTLVHALEPRHPSANGSSSPNLRVEIRSLGLDNANVRGALGDIDRIDASVSALDASVVHDERATFARIRTALVQLAGVAPRPIRAVVGADFSLPAREQSALSLSLDGSVGGVRVTAGGSLHGPRVDAHLDAQATPQAIRELVPQLLLESPASAHAELHGGVSGFRASLRVRGADGALDADAEGGLDVARETLAGALDLRLSEAHIGGQSVGLAVAHASVHGSLASPQGRLTLSAERLRVAGRAIDTAAIDAEGAVRAPRVTVTLAGPEVPDVYARATLAFGDGVDARGATVVLSRRSWRVVARVDRAHAGGGTFDATGIEVVSAGAPIRGEAHVRPESVSLRLSTTGMDLTPLLQITGTDLLTGGTLALDVDVRGNRAAARGHVHAALDATGPPGQARRRARVTLKLAGRRIDGDAQLALNDVKARATFSQIVVKGPLALAESWRSATGTVDVESDAPLAALRGLLPDDALPFQEIAGALELKVHVARREPELPPDAVLDASTRGLVLIAASAPGEGTQPPWQVRGVDLQLAASLDGATSRLALEAVLADRLGPVLHADAEAQAEWAKLVRAPRDSVAILTRTPVQLHVDAPERDLSTLPAGLRPSTLRGRVEATADLRGPIFDPRMHVQVRARALQETPLPSAIPFDGTAEASYDGHAVLARALLRGPEGVVLDARSDVDVRVADLLSPPATGLPWDAGGTVALHGFPLQSLLPREARGIGGLASGVVELEGLHRDARIDADLRVARPRLGVVCYDDGWMRLHADGRRLTAAAGVVGQGSRLTASIGAASSWASSLSPTVDARMPIDVAIEANDFRASALLPFVGDSFNELDGRIDAQARLRVGPGFRSGTMEGDVRVTGGVIEVPAIGERLHDVTAALSIRPWGTLRVDGITARGSTGRLAASAQIALDGLHVRSATADLEIPAEQRMPITVEGVSLGEASGRVHADATMSPDQRVLYVTLTVPQLEVRLPHSAGHTLQSLDPAPDIAIGMVEPDGRFVVLPMHAPQKPRGADSIEVRGVLDLGGDVRIRRDANLDVELTGRPSIDLTDELRMVGTVHLSRGFIDVFGKRFSIDPASTIAFSGDTGNPQVVLTAHYDTRDGTRIYADVIGPMKKPKISLRSDPARSQDAIVGLLLFGAEEGLAGSPGPGQQPDPTQRAAGLASGPVAEALNAALSGITSLDVTARLDTSQAANPRPEVEVRLSNEVVARVSVQTGMPAPGEPPDRTLVSVDWRFRPRWSLESTVGDEGSTLIDVLWHYRY